MTLTGGQLVWPPVCSHQPHLFTWVQTELGESLEQPTLEIARLMGKGEA